MASALIEELKTVATEAKRSQIEDAVGSSWAALEAKEDPQGSGSRRMGGGGRGGVGTRVLDSKNNGRICWQPSPMGRLS